LFALLPVSFLAAMLLGDWLLVMAGYSSGEQNIPASVALKAGLPAVVVLVAPLVAAAWCGRRAQARGHPAGRALFLTAAIVAAESIVLNLVQVAVSWILGV
jgi:hypothetical protein